MKLFLTAISLTIFVVFGLAAFVTLVIDLPNHNDFENSITNVILFGFTGIIAAILSLHSKENN